MEQKLAGRLLSLAALFTSLWLVLRWRGPRVAYTPISVARGKDSRLRDEEDTGQIPIGKRVEFVVCAQSPDDGPKNLTLEIKCYKITHGKRGEKKIILDEKVDDFFEPSPLPLMSVTTGEPATFTVTFLKKARRKHLAFVVTSTGAADDDWRGVLTMVMAEK